MYLKSLALKGFKSFADRSVLALEPGIAAVVGPNGSGKSNISDAVLWVLGERNAKNLRGQAMEDVIFAGSSARKSVGIAEVDLVLDNSDGTLPVDYTEVAITRRMYRSGESEYLINGSLARRMDVLDILHDSGLGTGTNSIISQGNLDSLLSSKPEDRRCLIEEAAGVLKHKQRKLKSERKLGQMDLHLARVRDVAAEVERQLGPLERKAKRAQAYQGFSAELAGLSLVLAVDDLRALQGAWDEACLREQAIEGELGALREAIARAEQKVEEVQVQVQERSMNAGEVALRYRRAQSFLERFEGMALLLHEKQRSGQAYRVELEAAQAQTEEKLVLAQSDREQAEAQAAEALEARRQAEGILARLAAEQTAHAQKRSDAEGRIAEAEKAQRSYTAQIEQARSAQAKAKDLLSDSQAQEKVIAGHSKEIEIQLAHAQADLERAAAAQERNEAALAALEEAEAKAREVSAAAFAEREGARSAHDALREEKALLAAEIRGLEELERSGLGAGEALSWLLENQEEIKATISPLTQVIDVPADLDGLVEQLLGGDLSALLVEDVPAANLIAEQLGRLEVTGEVVLLPRTARIGDSSAAPPSGAALADVLACPDEYGAALRALLGDVFVCDTREEALAAHERDRDNRCFATRDGFAVWGSGKMAVGRGARGEEGALARHRRLVELRGREQSLNTACLEASGRCEAAEEALRRAQAKGLAHSQELAVLKGTLQAASDENRRAQEKSDALRREFDGLARQRAEAQAVLSSAGPEASGLEEELAALKGASQKTKEALEDLHREAAPLRQRTRELAEELSEARLQVATLTERETYALRVAEARSNEISSLIAQKEAAVAALAQKSLALSRIGPLLEVCGKLGSSVRRWTQQLEKQTLAVQDLSAGLHADMSEARRLAREAQAAFDAKNAGLAEVRVAKGRLEVQVEAAVSAIVHDCKTPLETALALPAPENRAETEETAFKLRRRIANMGTINPDAAVEYEELKGRYDYMAAQLADLAGARRALAKIVSVIDQRMEEDFVTTFEQVNINFQEIFSILFPGGSAHLSLVDPDNPETSGVEVSAQPRGKRITKMMLMSGGEKSLTALALLFAVYRIRQAPFYILDEVEAALDDSNLRRLAAYLDSLRANTQLIMITHQRRTMEMADVLYGISMQADGVTRVMSQKLDHALRYAE